MQETRLFTVLLVSFLFSTTADSVAAQTITHVPLFTFHGDSSGDRFGSSVSDAGDVNGDGFADLIVGAGFDDSNNGNGSGSARVLSGSDGSVLYNFNGDSAGNSFGHSVSGAGDVNGDGFADLIVGAFEDDNIAIASGSARVLSGFDGSVLYNFNGDSFADHFGRSVSGAGDVNGDGMADLIVGVWFEDNNGGDSGSALVLSGSDGSVLYNFDGDNSNDLFGGSVSGTGDVNGDGFADMIVGASGDDNNGLNNSGSARVLSGSDGSELYNFDGSGGNDGFGRSVSGAGDVNGDGFADLIVGAPGGIFAINRSGNARVLSGSDGSVLYNFDGDHSFDNFGHSVSGAGDVNGDGFADLIVGASGDDNNGSDSGSARVLSGSDGSVLYNFDGDNPNDMFGESVSGAGDVNGDGINDFIVGARNGGANDGGYARVFLSQILVSPVSYSAPNGRVFYDDSYNGTGDNTTAYSPLMGGVGDLTDGIVATHRWYNNRAPYVGWQWETQTIDLNFEFETQHRFQSVRIWFEDDPAGVTSISHPASVTINGVTFIGHTPQRGQPFSQVFELDGSATDQISIQMQGQAEWIMISEIQFLPISLLLGDCNHDDVVNFLDIAPFISILSAADYLAEADIDQNGVVDFLDIQHFIALLSP